MAILDSITAGEWAIIGLLVLNIILSVVDNQYWRSRVNRIKRRFRR